MNVDHISKGTLFPFGGNLCTHWEYLAATSAEPASVSARIRIEDSDLDGYPLWYVYSGVAKPTYFSSALVREGSVWVEGGRSKLLDRLVSFAPPEDEFASSARFLYRATRQLNRGTRLWGPPRRGFYTAHTWGKEANAAAGRVSFFADYFSNLIYFVIVVWCGIEVGGVGSYFPNIDY